MRGASVEGADEEGKVRMSGGGRGEGGMEDEWGETEREGEA
jgi:hypothetical protein